MLQQIIRYYGRVLAGIGAALFSVALVAPADAAVGVLRNGVLWSGTFEGDVADLTASTPAWAVFDRNGFAAESTDGNIYSYVSGSVATSVSYSQSNSWAGSGLARTAEVRMRVPNADFAAGDGVGAMALGVNDQAYTFRIHPGFITYNAPEGLTTIATLDTSEFHTYRAVVDQTTVPIFSLYIDDDATPVYTSNDSWFTSSGFDNLVFGDISTGGLSGRLDVDFISWTPGAFPVIPEPSSLGMLALGSVLLIRRRRRVQG